MSIITFLIVGIFVGWFAGLVVKGRGFGGLGDLVVGVVGAIFGGFIFDLWGVTNYGFWETVGTSVVGAIALLFIIGLFNSNPKIKSPIL